MYGLYGALLRLAWAFVLPYQTLKAILNGQARPPLGERLGLLGAAGRGFRPQDAPSGPAPGGFWIHAVSVGEVRLALPLVARLKECAPRAAIHLTTNTPTGRSVAEAAIAAAGHGRPDSVSLLPIDLPGPMGRLLDRLRPRAIIVMETEIWPNLLRQSVARGIPVILVNGRISRRAYPRYRAVRPFMRRVLPGLSLFGMQSPEEAARIRDLGAPAERIRVNGNLKFDLPVGRSDGSRVRHLMGLGESDPVFVAGSTAPGEEAAVLEAFGAVRRHAPAARLVLAPRHPEDIGRAVAAVRAAGLTLELWSRRSQASGTGAPPEPFAVLIVDRIGVLPDLYAAADVVFVGGSLVPRGGHNILEPAALGKPILFGPHMENFSGAARALTEAGAAFVAHDGGELGSLAVRFLADRSAGEAAGRRALQVVESNRGALDATIEMIAEAVHLDRRPLVAAARP
jgi:3-deoxy-D-manno-octulosonic-acid transferase